MYFLGTHTHTCTHATFPTISHVSAKAQISLRIRAHTHTHAHVRTHARDILYNFTCQRRLGSACASAQSDQNLRWSHKEAPRSLAQRRLISLRGCKKFRVSALIRGTAFPTLSHVRSAKTQTSQCSLIRVFTGRSVDS